MYAHTDMCVLTYVDTGRKTQKRVEEHGNRVESVGTGVRLLQIGILI